MNFEANTISIPALSLAISILSVVFARISIRNQKLNNTKILDLQNKVFQEQLIQFKTMYEQNRLADRAAYIPFFMLKVDKKIYVKNDLLIIPLELKNVGRETAVNISLKTIHEEGGLEDYFETSNLNNNIHFVHDYLSEYYAEPKGTVSFSACCEMHDSACDVTFKVQFFDLLKRKYQQEFRFQYWFKQCHEISRNKTSSHPELIDDVN